MSLLDQWGAPIQQQRTFARAITRDKRRGLFSNFQNVGIEKLIPQTDRRVLAALSRRLVWNMGVPKAALRMKAEYSVNGAWDPVYHGEDQKRGEMAEEWLRNDWYMAPDVRGGADWWDLLELVSRCIDRDGEAFVLLTERADGWPALQHIPAHTIRMDVSRLHCDMHGQYWVKGGIWDGARITDGVIHDDKLMPLAYRHYHSDLPNDYDDIPAAAVLHVYDREFPEQMRGFPSFAHALGDLQTSLASAELEMLRQVIISSIYLVEKGVEVDPNDPTYESVINTTAGEAVLVETVSPGVRHIHADQSFDTITHQNPGPAWEEFQDRIARSTLAPVWPYGLTWKSSGQGTAERIQVIQGRQFVRIRQRTLKRFARSAVTYALAKAYRGGITGSTPNSMLWGFTMPARLTVDDGREDKACLEAVQAGTCSLSQYLANQGSNLREHFTRLANERVEAERIAAKVSAREGVTITAADLLPKGPPAPAAPGQQQEVSSTPES